MNTFRSLLTRWLPAGWHGRLDYLLGRNYNEISRPLNGQAERRKIFEELLSVFHFQAIVETGTFRGVTTEYFAQFGLPVYSIEVNERFYEYSKLRLRNAKNVFLRLGSSAEVLPKLLSLQDFQHGDVFLYLDAHWQDFLPLKEELEAASKLLPGFIAMIDDFAVPGDSGYGYDDYGNGNILSLMYLKQLSQFNYGFFFPAQSSERETGYKRGCVVLASDESRVERLRACQTLRYFGTNT